MAVGHHMSRTPEGETAMRKWLRILLYVALAVGLFLITALAVLRLASNARNPHKWGPFRGQVVDMETGEPIPDAAVLVVWWEVVATPVHGITRFYEAKETVTDSEGLFEIAAISVPFWKLGVQPGEVWLFAPAYVEHARVVMPPKGRRFVDPTVVQMRRLKTREELLQKRQSYPYIPEERMISFIRAINVERRMLGLDPVGPIIAR